MDRVSWVVPCVSYTEPRRFASRVLKKAASGVLNICEAYLVKRRSFRTRTFHASRFTNDEDGFLSTLRAVLPCCPRCKREWLGYRSEMVADAEAECERAVGRAKPKRVR
jgi:hypothetical protein